MALQLDKPLVVTAVGAPRANCSVAGSTWARDAFLGAVLETALASRRTGAAAGVLAGVVLSSWGGEARPREAGGMWRPGDALLDPPHEAQGCASLYDVDSTALRMLYYYAARAATPRVCASRREHAQQHVRVAVAARAAATRAAARAAAHAEAAAAGEEGEQEGEAATDSYEAAAAEFGATSQRAAETRPSPFVTANGTRLYRFGEPYRFVGANMWYAMHLGAAGAVGGDRPRLVRELDRLQELGISNIRVLAASEGPDREPWHPERSTPWRILPSMQPSPCAYNEAVVAGLDFLLAEMAKRDMTAVLILGNMWPWSGGFAQYVSWAASDRIPYPPPAAGGSWDGYQQHARWLTHGHAERHGPGPRSTRFAWGRRTWRNARGRHA